MDDVQVTTLTPLQYGIVFFAQNSPNGFSITQVMNLLFLADVEHRKLYGAPLCDLEWTWHKYGPFSQPVYNAVEALAEADLVRDVIIAGGARVVRAGVIVDPEIAPALGPSQYRALRRTLDIYGKSSLAEMKVAAYRTATMMNANPGDRLLVEAEPRTYLADLLPDLKALLDQAPLPDDRSWGNPDVSRAEDEQIMRELAALRRAATEESP